VAVSKPYPEFDPRRVELLICPVSGKPIFRSISDTVNDGYVNELDFQPAVQRSLNWSTPPASIWIAKDIDT
jgi:hypothetical protein